MTKLEALNLIGQGLKCLMDSDRPCRDNLSAIEYTLDGTSDDCELAIDFVQESENEKTGRVERKRSCFMVKAEAMDGEEEIG